LLYHSVTLFLLAASVCICFFKWSYMLQVAALLRVYSVQIAHLTASCSDGEGGKWVDEAPMPGTVGILPYPQTTQIPFKIPFWISTYYLPWGWLFYSQ
jgi:hypothetical protein